MMTSRRDRRRASGVVLVVALLVLTIFASLGLAVFTSSSMNLLQSSNVAGAAEARLAAESGLSFLIYRMSRCGVSGSLRGQVLLDSLAAKLGTAMNGTPNLGGAVLAYDGATITVPRIGFGGGKSFTGQITLPAADTLRLTVTGRFASGTGPLARAVQRQVCIDLHPMWDQALGFGICSRGPVEMGMNTDLSGVLQASAGSIYSAAAGIAVSCGSGHISGDVSVSAPAASTDLRGTTVDGTVRYNVPPVTMPTINRAGYKSLATTVMNLALPPAGTYKNIRIPPNTNPVFNGIVTIQGVMYVEAPNNVQFMNNVSFTGVIVADDPPPGSPDSANYITFKNNMTFLGPELLPSTPEFTNVRKFQGASVLCPGFSMEFKNNLSYAGGIMALKSLIAKNNVNTTLFGSLLIYGDAGLDFKNNSDMDVRLSGSAPPPGFSGYGLPALMPDPNTYEEKLAPAP